MKKWRRSSQNHGSDRFAGGDAGESALALARLYQDQGNRLATARTLLDGSTYSWPYRGWWGGALKIVVRSFVPARVRSTYQLSKRKLSKKGK